MDSYRLILPFSLYSIHMNVYTTDNSVRNDDIIMCTKRTFPRKKSHILYNNITFKKCPFFTRIKLFLRYTSLCILFIIFTLYKPLHSIYAKTH